MASTRSKRVVLALVIVGALLSIGLLWTPSLVRNAINDSLYTMPDGYRGHVDDIDFHVASGAMDLVGLTIFKADGSVKLPYLKMDALRVSVVDGVGKAPALELRFLSPEANLIDSPNPRRQQFGPHIDLAELKQKLKLQLRRVVVEDGQVHFRNFSTKPQVDVYASDLNVLFDELTDCLPPSTTCNAALHVEAAAMAHAPLNASGTLVHDETGRIAKDQSWRFDLKANLKDLRLPTVNDALIEYAKVDVQHGKATLFANLHRHDDRLFGSARPVFSGVDVVGRRSENTKLWTEMVGGVAAHFLEKRKGRVVVHFDKAGKGDLKTKIEVEDQAPPAVEQHAQRD